jgi:hypothetical protein
MMWEARREPWTRFGESVPKIWTESSPWKKNNFLKLIKLPLSIKNAILINGVVRWIRQPTLEMFFFKKFLLWS